jgi:hypothetical protein
MKGLELIGPKMKPCRMAADWPRKEVLLHCWRGNAKQQYGLADEHHWPKTGTLEGGYKAYRRCAGSLTSGKPDRYRRYDRIGR